MDHVQKYLQGKMKERYIEAKELFLDGHSLTSIEKMTGYNRKWLSQLLKAEGYEIKKNNQKYNYNDTVFEKIDTEEKAYWLGFLYADGCVTFMGTKGVKLSLKAEDEKHLEKFRDFVCPELPIDKYWAFIKKEGTKHNSVRVTVTNSKIANDLIKLGCYPDKSLAISFPYEHVPKELLRHFVRGFFDGDGSVAKTNKVPSVRFHSASYGFIEDVQNHLCEEIGISKNKISKRSRKGRKDFYTFSNGSKKDVSKLCDYFYKNSFVYLSRKEKIIKSRLEL